MSKTQSPGRLRAAASRPAWSPITRKGNGLVYYRNLRVVALIAAAILPLQIAPVATAAASVPSFAAFATGTHNTCALTSSGGVKCWGDNNRGQLGDGTTTDSRVPVDVSDLPSAIGAIVAGGSHTCALTSEGGAKCWGENANGQLGNGTTTQSSVPVDVQGLGSGVSAIVAGGSHTCALTTVGGVKCWGSNSSGQLGGGTSIDSGVPVDVPGLGSGVSAIVAGGAHTCALTTGGAVKCWGRNNEGQLGNLLAIASKIPVDVSGLANGVRVIAAGYADTCALLDRGGVKCWGWNGYGQLGDGTTTQAGVPVDVAGLASGVRAMAMGYGHTCALMRGGGVLCWGADYAGQLGDGTTTQSSVPVHVSGLASGVRAIAAGGSHTCALTSVGGLKCWGYNHYGQLGNGRTNDSSVPVDVSGLPLTDSMERGVRRRSEDLPVLPLLAGLGVGIAMLVRRRIEPALHAVDAGPDPPKPRRG